MNGDDYMEVRLQKWGNSMGIRIPSNMIKSLNLKTNDMLNIDLDDNKIVISVPQRRKISLEKRFREYKGKNLAKSFTWDESVGKEIW